MDASSSGIGTDRALTLLHLHKRFSASLKDSDSYDELDKLLPLFNRIMSMYTPEELVGQFKELISFTQRICEVIVTEIRQRANSENTREAAVAVNDFIQPSTPDRRGWVMLKSVTFILNSGMSKVLEPICKTKLPSTLVRVFYLFFDLPSLPEDSPEAEVRRRMYDLLVTLMNSLCEHSIVASEMIQCDDLNWLFIGASTPCPIEFRVWRDANFAFLSSIVRKALNSTVIKYIHSKGCIGHYLKNCRTELSSQDKTILLCNIVDLMRQSAFTTTVLLDDFKNANGYEHIVSFCISSEADVEENRQILHALVSLVTAGESVVHFGAPSSLSFYNFKLPATSSHSTETVRVPDVYFVFEKCFIDGSDELCLLVLEKILYLYKAEKLNYFIVDKYYPLYLFVERMIVKGTKVQEKVLELVEFVLRELNFVPRKELSALNSHAKHNIITNDCAILRRFFSFFFQILPVNISVKDAFRELLILETFLNVVQTYCTDLDAISESRSAIAQMAMDLLVTTTKGNVLNAQFITENLEIRIIKIILLSLPSSMNTAWREEFRGATLVLIKNLLFLAKNEQLFSSLLQLLFSDPGNVQLCVIILKLFTSVLLESHKVRVMFRRSGGYICLMTLLLHLENALRVSTSHISAHIHFNESAESGDHTNIIKSASEYAILDVLQYISLIFRVLTVSMRYEPSNAKYFLTEVKPAIINSILRCLGCFTQTVQMSNANREIWEQVNTDENKSKLSALHFLFENGTKLLEPNFAGNHIELDHVPLQIFNEFCIFRLLFDVALDNYEKQSNVIVWADEKEWLQNIENVEAIPLFSFSSRTILVHPSAVICLLQMIPSISANFREISTIKPTEDSGNYDNLSELKENKNNISEKELNLWTCTAQFYIALVLKALMRIKRNQQIMCQHDMPKILLDVGIQLFKTERHPLLPSFYYLFERLACQSMHPRELRRFLRLDQPLCCLNLDDSDNENSDETVSGGPVPIHRVKALVSMLTPRNHSLVHTPAFVEFDLTIEGFACLFIPSISNIASTSSGGGLNLSNSTERLFPPLNGLTFMTWFYVDNFPANSNISNVQNSNICLITIVRNFEGTEAKRNKKNMTPNLENHLTCFYVHLNMMERCLLISTAEHSVVDELRKDFIRPPETFVKIPLSEQYFQTRQWNHLAVALSKALLKQSQVEVYLNGRCLLSQKLTYISANVGGVQAQVYDHQPVHALVGTPPFLRRPSNLRWKIASLYLMEDPISVETVRRIIQLQPHYIGNLQLHVDGSTLINEEKLIFVFNAKATAELTAQTLRPMLCKSDCEVIASLLGISINDNSTPLRVLWNTAAHANGDPRTLGAILIGYLGMRSFSPCPVSSLLDSIGGVAPLLGLIAMCTDSHGLYASLKVLVSAVQTNNSIVNSLLCARGYQTLAMLLEEKAHLINSHILHLILSLAGTVDASKENTVIMNLQTFDDLLCDLDVWTNTPDEVKKLLFEHFYELIIDDHGDNLQKVRNSSLYSRLLIFLYENRTSFPIRHDILFRLIGAIVQPPCDAQLLLRLGQTVSATISCSSRSNGNTTSREAHLPFHISELERLLLDEINQSDNVMNLSDPAMESSSTGYSEVDSNVYLIYVRNRLLNIILTLLAHSTGSVNNRLCETITSSLGFGWILSLCAPGINSGTLYLALKILMNIIKYPNLMEKFRDGTANSGWLSDADSIIQNRAAVVLGFSVSAHGGAIGSKVDINPELSNCSGFAALEHLMHAHADKPFVYLAMLAILFNQPNSNVQPLDEFTVEAIWSHVFSMKEKGSVSDVLESVQPCGDVLIAIMAMVRACVQRQRQEPSLDECHWSHSHPMIIMQLLTFLYQNSEPFFAICHTEMFVVAMFSTIVSPATGQLSPPQSTSFEKANNILGLSRSVTHILELLTNILLNDLCLPHDTRTEWPFDVLVEFLESGGSMCSSQSVFYTELVNACIDRFMASNMFFANVALMAPRSAQTQISQASESTALNVVHFLSKLIDSVWNCMYRGNPIRILKCFLKLLAEAHVSNKAAAQLTCTEVHLNALFRIVLYLISRPIDNVDTQMSVLDTLAEIVRNQHLLLSKNANNPLYYGALVHLVFMLSEKPDIQNVDSNGENLERGTAQVSMCAQNVWGLLWQQKKVLLDEIFKRHVDLDLYTARASCGETANRYWLQFVDAQTECPNIATTPTTHNGQSLFASNFANSRVNVSQLQQNLQSKLKSGLQKLANRKSLVFASSISASITSPPCVDNAFHFERLKIEPETFYMWIRVHISLLRELVQTQCQRYHEWHAHVRKWCLKEWHNTEAELTRERGLWGPERCSNLDKYELDVTEGPHRIRRKLVPNPDFYKHYPYRPYLDSTEAKSLRGKLAISKDSRLYYERMRRRRFHTMDDRIVDHTSIASIQQSGDDPSILAGGNESMSTLELNLSTELNLSMIKRMVQKNLVAAAAKSEKLKDSDTASHSGKADEEKSIGDDDSTSGPTTATDVDADEVELQGDSTNAIEDVDKLKENSIHKAARKETSELQSSSSQAISTPYSRQISSPSTGQLPPRPGSASSGGGAGRGGGPDNQTLLRLLEQGEQLHSMFRCARIQRLDTLEGLLLFGKDHYYVVDGFTLLKTREIRDLDFLPEQFHDPIVPYMAMGSSNRPTTKSNRRCSKFSYDDIKEVHKRRYLLQPIALEVFSADGRNYLLAFPRKIRDRVFQKFVSMAKSASSDVARTMAEQRKLLPAEASSTGHQLINQLMGQQSMTHKWQRGEITNFQYLMYLNTLAGRSYNDLSQYPVFPWIVADYDSERLDLTNPKTFRDLSKPMGAQSTERLAKFLKRFREWDDPSGDTPPYMYGTHYSSAMIVLSYLVRLEPFTEQFLKLQGGHFDLADRMFHSVRDAFISASRNNMADVRELIPEFFYLPEMFLNDNNFDLGVKQNGVMLHNVQLPTWAHSDPHEFIRLHREALECDYVSEHLHEWIDLIFGYRQNGDAARDANNVFHHLFYEENVNFDIIDDPLTRNATLGFINNFGQIPSQLFRKPHPQKRVSATTTDSNSHMSVPGVTTPKLFYHCLKNLRVSSKPVKELKAAVGDIVVNEKNQVIVLEQNKVFLPPTSYLAWGFNDRSVRMGTVGTEKSECICETSDVYEITCMATTDGKTVFTGLTTGTVLVWTTSGKSSPTISSYQSNSINNSAAGGSASATGSSSTTSSLFAQLSTSNFSGIITRKALDAHTDVVTAVAACAPHNFVVSASRDHTVVVWHLTRFTFIRQLGDHPAAVTAVAVNDATGDIATASNSFIFVWTVNGALITSINSAVDSGIFSNPSSLVLCLSFSTMNEWDVNNVIMCGTSDGLVKIYSITLSSRADKESNGTNKSSNYFAHRRSPNLVNPHSTPLASEERAREVRAHILRRQQRIQYHHNQRLMMVGTSGQSMTTTTSVDSSQTSSPIIRAPHVSSSENASTTVTQFSPSSQTQLTTDNITTEKTDTHVVRTPCLRRVLSEHTAFYQDNNPHPAPITSIRATKDHRSLLVGDGVGRVWLWTVDHQRQ